MKVIIKEMDAIEVARDTYTREEFIALDNDVEIHTDKEGWEYLRDCAIELIGCEEYDKLESNVEILVERVEQLELDLNNYIDKFGKLDGGNEDE